MPYPQVAFEEVLARDPEVIIDMGEMADTCRGERERQAGSGTALEQVRFYRRGQPAGCPRRGLRHLCGAGPADGGRGQGVRPHAASGDWILSVLYRLGSVQVSYDSARVLDVAALEFEAGRMVSLVGPNGAGKSTLLTVMAGLNRRHTGECLFEGRSVRKWPRREFSRMVSFVPQNVRLEFPFTAEQVVLMGRTPYCDGLFDTPADHEVVARAMKETDTVEFRGRDFRSLSGGERQRVVLASALAQEPRVLLLDEPTTFLDVKHQLAIQGILKRLCEQGLLVVAATHDLNLAAAYSDCVVVLSRGVVVASGPAPGSAAGRDDP